MFIDHAVGVGIVGVLDLDLAVDHVAAIEIAGALIPAVIVALVLIAKVRAENHAHAVSLRTDKRIAVPNLGKNYSINIVKMKNGSNNNELFDHLL